MNPDPLSLDVHGKKNIDVNSSKRGPARAPVLRDELESLLYFQFIFCHGLLASFASQILKLWIPTL